MFQSELKVSRHRIDRHLGAIDQLLTIDAGTGVNDRLIIDHTAKPTNDSGTLDAGQITGFSLGSASIAYSNFDQLTVNLSDNNDTVTVQDTDIAGAATTINTDKVSTVAGNDIVLINGATAGATINLESGEDTVVVTEASGPLTIDADQGTEDQIDFDLSGSTVPVTGAVLSGSGNQAVLTGLTTIGPSALFQPAIRAGSRFSARMTSLTGCR